MNSIITTGVDISKKKFDASFSHDGRVWHHQAFDNNPQGFQVFVKWLDQHKVSSVHVVMEATGRYGEDLAEFCYAKGYKVSILNPAQIKYYSKSCLKRNKTDKVDSKLIAEFASKHGVTLWKPLSDPMKDLRSLERTLEAFKEDRTQITNRLEQEKNPTVSTLLQKRVAFIDQQIKELETALKELRGKDEMIDQSITLLESIPGVGQTTAFSLLGELPDLSTFQSAKQLGAYAGLNPHIRSSGSSVRRRGSLSKTGSKSLRKLLYFPAMAAMRHNPILREFAERLREKGKKPKVIIAAVMRKLLHMVFGILKRRCAFQG